MTTISREDARVLIGKIREDNGGISLEDRAACPPAVLRALENVRRKLGAATKTLATNLYSKDTRFVYELIQNAEDNKYTRAEADETDLYLSFSMYPDRIVIESNEDGFGEGDVKAICSTGESTKNTASGYIGEKGIGFKSVFKVAKKVHIQSGPFSFSFEYTRDSFDDGLGMVTPLDEDYEDLPEGVRTRITLTLLDHSSFEQRVQDLLDVPDTLLLFLTKLKVLNINIYPQNQDPTETKFIYSTGKDGKSKVITKIITIDGNSTKKDLYFYVIRRTIENLPRDEARKHTNQATVALAFPVNKNDQPIIKQQHVFAFLPLRLAGFTFLIQSDFITQASREDVFHSKRNRDLLSGVAKTFQDAVLQFCDHPLLQYQWMQYLPNDSISDEFWKNLRPQIISLLCDTRCLRPWNETSLRLPSQLQWLIDDYKDQYGQPLFADSVEETYLSQHYAIGEVTALKSLGTHRIDSKLMIARIRSDLESADSKMKAITTDENWHTRAAKLLSKRLLLARSIDARGWAAEAFESLNLIPLQGCRWVSGKTGPIYLPNTEETPIPSDLGLDLVQPVAALNIARRTFFRHLGVKTALPRDIILRINMRYNNLFMCTMSENIAHLRYLYWNLPQGTLNIDENIFLVDRNRCKVFRTAHLVEHIYFEEEMEEYGTMQLLQCNPFFDPDAPGLTVHYLNAKYLDAVPVGALHHGRSWKQWLTELLDVQSYPQLQNSKHRTISDEFKYIIEYRPEKLIGLLKRYWSFYEPKMITTIVNELKNCRMPLDAGLMIELKSTFLPLPRLKVIIERLKIVSFPFLIMPEKLTTENENEWRFLKRFDVRSNGRGDELHFYVEALKRIADDNEDECSPDIEKALFEIYSAIEQNCSGQEDATYVYDYFKDREMIYIPASTVQNAKWVSSEYCVWTAPEWLEAKSRLRGVLKYADCEHLFRVILKIGDANWRDYIMDLETLKEQNNCRNERVLDIYERLWREFQHDSSFDRIRSLFEESALVFVPSQSTWHPLSSCIWADDQTRIPRKVSIKTPYETLEDFFNRMLKVPRPSLDMHVQALKELAQSPSTPLASEIKQRIMLISSMSPTVDDVADLRRANIFSVVTTNGQRVFTNTTAEFAIVDRLEYSSAFAGRIRLLDYSIEEVRACRPFLLSLDLTRRHLSELVNETTTVRDGLIDTKLSRSFRMKAYALFRCTVHYQSQKSRDGDRSLYNQLLCASIYVSDGISKSISIVQYGETVTVENSRANFHLDENEDGLRLYVPRDESSREECFFRQLPRRLMIYLAISDPTAEALLNGVIGCKSLIAVDAILKDAGIVEVDGIIRPSESDQIIYQSDDGDVSLEDGTGASIESQTSHPGRSTPISTVETVENAYNEADYPADMRRGNLGFDNQSSVPSRPFLPPSEESVNSTRLMNNAVTETGYASLLERVIQSAGRMTIPAWGSHSIDILQSAGPREFTLSESVLATRSMERDRKVGAAGELLIFEILLNLGLVGFTEDNWKSTIRKEVCIHNKYQNLGAWSGRETADITYADSEGDLTKLLIEKGYLESDTWEAERPTYFLEVKTTTKDFSEQFYMSGSQYNRMQRMQLQPRRAASNVYVILRVFNLEGRIGLRVYVDPESSRRDGELRFDVDTWVVKPASRIIY